MTDAEITRLLAEKIMDWRVYTEQDGDYDRWQRRLVAAPQDSCFIDLDSVVWRYGGTAYTSGAEQPWRPLHDMNHAMMVVEALRKQGWGYRIGDHISDPAVHWAEFGRGDYDTYEHGREKSHEAIAHTPARAICLAAVEALVDTK